MRTKHASQGRLLPSTPGVVDVALVPVSIDTAAAVVDVALVVPRPEHVSFPKPSTILDRAIAKRKARLLDEKNLRAWAFAVKTRDRWRDQKTGLRVHRRLDLDPQRAEAHHIVSKDDRAVRYDIRNGITLSLATHILVERGELQIEGTVFFVLGGCRYIDATYAVNFVRT